jgi:molybdenum cofactor biosynthesis protein B
MAHLEHRANAPTSVGCFVLTISDTRTVADDTSGDTIVEVLQQTGHRVAGRAIVKDDATQVRAAIRAQLENRDVQAVIMTGGTGIGARDTTYEAIDVMLEKRLPGFGELFRMLSYQEIGSAAMLSRACAGTINSRIIIALPGSQNAVRLAMTKLVAPELGHLVAQATR